MRRTIENSTIIGLLFLAVLVVALPGCAQQTKFVEVKVPVPIECKIEQIELSPLPQVNAAMDIFQLAQTRIAQIIILKGDRNALKAANTNPCPAPEGTPSNDTDG